MIELERRRLSSDGQTPEPLYSSVSLLYFNVYFLCKITKNKTCFASIGKQLLSRGTTNKISYPVYRYMYKVLLAINVVHHNKLLQENVQRVSGNAKFSVFYEDGNIEVLSVIFKQRVLQNQVFLSNNKNELFSRVFTLKDNRVFFRDDL